MAFFVETSRASALLACADIRHRPDRCARRRPCRASTRAVPQFRNDFERLRARACALLAQVARRAWCRIFAQRAIASAFFSHMLLHANTMHIAINCVWLLAFGPVVARRFGGFAFLVFFALCGVAGALFYVALNWGDTVGVIGASGAISGLMGAAIRMMRMRQPYLNAAHLPLVPILSSQVLGFSAVWLAVNLLTGISWICHDWPNRAGRLAGPYGRLSGRSGSCGPVRPPIPALLNGICAQGA